MAVLEEISARAGAGAGNAAADDRTGPANAGVCFCGEGSARLGLLRPSSSGPADGVPSYVCHVPRLIERHFACRSAGVIGCLHRGLAISLLIIGRPPHRSAVTFAR